MTGPALPTLVYDGDCAFCTSSARWVERHLPAGRAVVAPWQSLDLDELGLTPADGDAAAWWVETDGRRRRGHRAIASSLRAIGGLWAVLGVLLSIPPISWLAAGVYALVVRNRHRMPGATDACRIDQKPPETAAGSRATARGSGADS